MGNCIARQKEVIKIIKTDGEMLVYKPPMKVHYVLSKYEGHAICDALPALQHLNPDADMVGGRVYYLFPLLAVPPHGRKKTLEISHPVATEEGTGVLRIKLVISKQELQALLRKGVKIDNMVYKLHTISNVNDADTVRSDHKKSSIAWMPVLESIPEGN